MDNGGGFQLLYESLDEAPVMSNRSGSCGGDFRTEKGILTSPSYPEIYSRDQSCTYTISLPAGKYVNITLMSIDMSCDGSDYIEMRDGNSGSAPLMMLNYCGEPLTSLQTTQNSLWIK